MCTQFTIKMRTFYGDYLISIKSSVKMSRPFVDGVKSHLTGKWNEMQMNEFNNENWQKMLSPILIPFTRYTLGRFSCLETSKGWHFILFQDTEIYIRNCWIPFEKRVAKCISQMVAIHSISITVFLFTWRSTRARTNEKYINLIL